MVGFSIEAGTYLKYIDDYGWASIAADYGEGATVFFEGSGTDITLLDLGGSVCPMDSGMAGERCHPTGTAGITLARGVRLVGVG